MGFEMRKASRPSASGGGQDSPSFVPAYRRLGREELARRAEEALERLKECNVCPHRCGVDRTAGEKGFCKAGARALVSSYGPHFGEEAPLVGLHGSGTIFFGFCNMRCLYCQNYQLSWGGEGDPVTAEELARMMLWLQKIGCHNINFVTPTHFVPQILEALVLAAERGLELPLVYNCGGYEALETLALLEGVVDIYMPDFKYADAETARRYSGVRDYPAVAKAAIKEMQRQVGDLTFNEHGIALRGLLVRHLVLPGGLAGTEQVMEFLAREVSPDCFVNVMAQYHPCLHAWEHPPLDRRPTPAEYRAAVDAARDRGLRVYRDWVPPFLG